MINIRSLIYRIKPYLCYKKMSFDQLSKAESIHLYAGDVPYNKEYKQKIGLSLHQSNYNHIKHNVIQPFQVSDNSVDSFQSEDVFEHIDYEKLVGVFNEIYRVLKPGGIFRLSLPDYRNEMLYNRSVKDENGNIVFDAGGGGVYENGQIKNGGHLWFPVYESVKALIDNSNFSNYQFYHFYNELGDGIVNEIDYKIGFVKRTPDHDIRYLNTNLPLSIVVDCIK